MKSSPLMQRPPCSDWFLANLKRSVQFLEKFRIIDYSLLVGIHFRDRAHPLPLPGEDDLGAVQLRDGVGAVMKNRMNLLFIVVSMCTLSLLRFRPWNNQPCCFASRRACSGSRKLGRSTTLA